MDRVRVTVQNLRSGQYWNGQDWVSGWEWNLAELEGETWTLPQVNLDAEGQYSVLLWAWDSNENRSNWSDNSQTNINANSIIGDIAPVATFSSPTSTSVGVTTLRGGVTDDVRVDRVRVVIQHLPSGQYWNGQAWVDSWHWNLADLGSSDDWSLPNVDLDRTGRYSVLLWAWDNEENRSNWRDNAQSTMRVN